MNSEDLAFWIGHFKGEKKIHELAVLMKKLEVDLLEHGKFEAINFSKDFPEKLD